MSLISFQFKLFKNQHLLLRFATNVGKHEKIKWSRESNITLFTVKAVTIKMLIDIAYEFCLKLASFKTIIYERKNIWRPIFFAESNESSSNVSKPTKLDGEEKLV